MSWQENLRRVTLPDGRTLIAASFRGVPFFVESAARSGGRRAVVHEFPGRDAPFVEDLGRKARTFPVEGYFVGDDFLAQRDALIAELEDKAGPGELKHPEFGVRSAIAVSFTTGTRRAEGRFATISIEFAEAPAQMPVPVEVVDGAEQVSSSADAALEAVETEFGEQFDPAGLPSFALASAQAALTKAAAALGAALAPVVSVTQELASLTNQIALLTATASSLVRAPADVLGAFRDALGTIADTAKAAPGAVRDALVDAYAADLGALVDALTSTRARELANQVALIGALRRILAIEAARLAPLATYVSIEEATAARDSIAALLEEQAHEAEDTSYPALVDLRSKVLAAVPGDAAFARVVTVHRNLPVPSLLLAYQLYGSVELEQDIVDRNGIRHPGLIAGDVRVLSDV